MILRDAIAPFFSTHTEIRISLTIDERLACFSIIEERIKTMAICLSGESHPEVRQWLEDDNTAYRAMMCRLDLMSAEKWDAAVDGAKAQYSVVVSQRPAKHTIPTWTTERHAGIMSAVDAEVALWRSVLGNLTEQPSHTETAAWVFDFVRGAAWILRDLGLLSECDSLLGTLRSGCSALPPPMSWCGVW